MVTGTEAVVLADLVWPCYDQVFGDYPDVTTWRSDLFERHAARDGYRLAVDVTGDRVTGFAWGYLGQRGQYWSDRVHAALPHDLAETWVGGHFEVVELAVLPDRRRGGLGQTLHDHLLDGVHRRCLLGTSDDSDDPAVRLYTRSGWTKLGLLEPGVQIMGLERRRPVDSG